MRVLGIDPSYTSTGMALLVEGHISRYKTISVSDSKVYDIVHTTYLASQLADQVLTTIQKSKPDIVIIEFPVLNTPSGAYLGLSQQAFYERFKQLSAVRFLLIAPAGWSIVSLSVITSDGSSESGIVIIALSRFSASR